MLNVFAGIFFYGIYGNDNSFALCQEKKWISVPELFIGIDFSIDSMASAFYSLLSVGKIKHWSVYQAGSAIVFVFQTEYLIIDQFIRLVWHCIRFSN